MGFSGPHRHHVCFGCAEPCRAAASIQGSYEAAPRPRFVYGRTIYRKSANHDAVKRDGKQWYEEGPHSDEMKALSKRFGILHGISSLLNLAVFIGSVTYGFTLAARI